MGIQQKHTPNKSLDKHHVCWPRRVWNVGYAKALRTHWYFMIRIPRKTLHAKIHHEMGEIPIPSGNAARQAYEQVINLERYGALHKDDPIEKRLGLLASLFDCIDQPTADAFRQQLRIVRQFNLSPEREPSEEGEK